VLAFKEIKFEEKLDVDLDQAKKNNKEFREALYKQFESLEAEPHRKK
jgi:hypothetical protein